uniref:KH_dom_type_1 domain-containing protein n=1 Tax=Caenorhabditis tropicalis TaxID=1561998 RepID=A0A1I7TVB9_9PELO
MNEQSKEESDDASLFNPFLLTRNEYDTTTRLRMAEEMATSSDYGDHENVASIMKETNTLIQLPDRSVEGPDPDPYAQQITITGHYNDVDKARKLMREKLKVVVPQPTDHDNSFWPIKNFSEKLGENDPPNRGDSEIPVTHLRQEAAFANSSQSKSSHGSTAKSCSESSEYPARQYARLSSASESAAHSTHSLPTFQETVSQAPFPQMVMMQPFMKGLPIRADMLQFDPFAFCSLQPAMRPVVEAEHSSYRPESSCSSRAPKQSRGMQRPSSAAASTYHCSTPNYPPRAYEKFREDEVRSSPRSQSGRTSLSGDEPCSDTFDERGRQYQQQQHQKYPKDETQRWKSGSRGDIFSKRNISFNRDYRGVSNARDHELSAGTPERPPSAEQIQFQSTHHLKLKPNEIDLEHERLFTHDSPQVEQHAYSAGKHGKEMTDDDVFRQLFSNTNLKETGKRSRAVSCFIGDDPSTQLMDSDGITDYAMTQASRSIDSFKKLSGIAVGKTMLEPRSRNERDYGKINLEHKDKNQLDMNDGERYPEASSLGARQYRMDPMKLIESVRESSEQLPRIHERQFNDILNEKEKELAAFRERNSESTLVQEKLSDETSSMDCAFQREHSSENVK